MRILVEAAATPPDDVGAHARGVASGADVEHAEERALSAQGFSGEVGAAAVLSRDGAVEFVVGLGDVDALDAEACRRAGAALARVAARCEAVTFDCDEAPRGAMSAGAFAESLAEGAALAAYRFDGRPGADAALGRVVLSSAAPELAEGIRRGEAKAAAVSLARDLVNMPAGWLTPTRFAELVVERSAPCGYSAEVFDEAAIAEMGLGGLAGVGKGSAEPPRLVRCEYVPEGAPVATVALVGKGITFDSGGLSLKSAPSMASMKYDLGGAAAVFGALSACRALGIGVRLVAFLPLAENMPGGRATRPGDVLRIRNGKTIEVLNTDAEGRLVLADALSLATEEHPDAIVDVATLTAGVVRALGRLIAGLMGNDDRLCRAVKAAAQRAGEACWRLPLPAAYRRDLDSDVADLRNIGAPDIGAALIAGLVLEEFVAETPWAHLDIAGPAWSEEDASYLKRGGTGFGVRTLLELLERYEPLGGQVSGEPAGRSLLR